MTTTPPRTGPDRVPSAAARVAAFTRFEMATLLRNGEQLLVAIVLPALALLGLTLTDIVTLPETGQPRIAVVAPGVLALAIVSSSFTSQAIQAAFDRRWGVLRQLATTPLGASGIVAGKVLAVLGVQVVQLLGLGALALTLGWRPQGGGIATAVVCWLLGSICFSALALVLAARLRAEAVLALANLLWVLAALAGGLLLPAHGSAVVAALPTGALGQGLRAALTEGSTSVLALAVLLGWTVLAGAAALRLFRPSE